MKLTIAGYGFVGKAHHELLKHYDITIYDPAQGYTDFGTPEGVLVCVSTPQADDGTCDMSNVESVIRMTPPRTPILIKSTISLEGWDHIQSQVPDREICFSPEFLRAKTAVQDLKDAKELYIGGKGIDFWKWVIQKPTVEMDPRALVLAKYFRNSFLALKVSFFNQMFDLCGATDIDYESVRKAVTADDRIKESHTWITDERGFGGHCFPKDTSAIVKTADNNKVDLTLLKTALEYNNIIQSL